VLCAYVSETKEQIKITQTTTTKKVPFYYMIWYVEWYKDTNGLKEPGAATFRVVQEVKFVMFCVRLAVNMDKNYADFLVHPPYYLNL